MSKIIHVHFIISKKNFYFGSTAAMLEQFSSDELGISMNYLRHRLGKKSHIITKKCLIIQDEIIHKKQNKNG